MSIECDESCSDVVAAKDSGSDSSSRIRGKTMVAGNDVVAAWAKSRAEDTPESRRRLRRPSFVVVNGVRYVRPVERWRTYFLKEKYAGCRLDVVLGMMFRKDRGRQDLDESVAYWQGVLKEGRRVTVMRRKERKEDEVRVVAGECDIILGRGDRFFLLDHVHERAVPAEIPPIIFENDMLLAVNKIAGLACEDDPKQHLTCQGIMRACVRPRITQNDGYLTHVHRLDRPVTGILIFAKTRGAPRRDLMRLICERKVSKTYVARVQGNLLSMWQERIDRTNSHRLRERNTTRKTSTDADTKKSKHLEYLGCAEVPRKDLIVDGSTLTSKLSVRVCVPLDFRSRDKRAYAIENEDIKTAITTFHFVHTFDDGTHLVGCNPYTGYRHQIRAHLEYLGTPIANDALYGGRRRPAGNLRHVFSDDGAGTLKRTIGASLKPWCPSCTWIKKSLAGEVQDEKFVSVVGEAIWLHAKRYVFPDLGVDIASPDPPFARIPGGSASGKEGTAHK